MIKNIFIDNKVIINKLNGTLYKFINKMGGNYTNKNRRMEMNEMTYVMMTKLGKHYVNKKTNHEYLLIE
jgi:hypothetical protein